MSDNIATCLQDVIDGKAGSLTLINHTPHPLRFFAVPYALLGSGEDADGKPVYQGFAESPWEVVSLDGADWHGQWVTIPPGGKALRLEESDSPASAQVYVGRAFFEYMPEAPTGVCGLIRERSLSAPAELPPKESGVFHVVPLPFLMGLQAAGVQRPDFIAPDTGAGAVRDDGGNIVGVRGFIRLAA